MSTQIPEVHVVSVGAITPLGSSAALSFAAVHARLSRTRLEDGDDGVSYHRAVVDALPAELSRLGRLKALLASALEDALAPLPALQARSASLPRAIPLWLALPEGVRSAEVCAERSEFGTAMWPVVTLSGGRASGLLALQAAASAIAQGQHELALVAGVDVQSDKESVAALALAGRLLTDDNPWGIVPSEGAAALLLMSSRLLARLGLVSLGVIEAVAASRDDAQQRGVPCIGEGLSQACHGVLDSARQQARAAEIYGDLNGERAQADEWGYSAPRLAQRCREVTDAQMPALWWGDQGHATGTLLVSLALYDGARGHARGSHLLVWTTSDSIERAAALIVAAPGSPIIVPTRALGAPDREQVEELLSEARFVSGQRTEQRASLEEQPSSGDAAVAASEQRLERHVDGLVVMHEAALDACATESFDPSLAYVQLRVLSTRTSREPLSALLHELPLSEPAMFAAAHEALSDAGGSLVRELSRALVMAEQTPQLVALGLWLCGDLSEPLGNWESCSSAGPGALGASFPYALGRLASSEQAGLLEPWL
jgi:3-oxoacyl-[acyl-carrier-protein] synthase-1